MENNNNLAAADTTVNSKSIFIDTYSRRSRLQTETCAATLNTSRIQSFDFTLDETYDYCTGICIVGIDNGTFTTALNNLSVTDSNHNIFNPINIKFWNKATFDFNRRNIFMPCFFRARNNQVSLKLEHQGLAANYNFYVVFRLENGPGVPKFEYNFIQKEFSILTGYSGTRNDDLRFDGSYETVKGVKFLTVTNSALTTIISLNYQGNIVMNELPDTIISDSVYTSYPESFFPLYWKCRNKTLTITTKVLLATGTDSNKLHCYLIEKPFDRKYL